MRFFENSLFLLIYLRAFCKHFSFFAFFLNENSTSIAQVVIQIIVMRIVDSDFPFQDQFRSLG